MTNKSRLKILGIGLVIVGLGAFLLFVYFPPGGHPSVLMVLGGWFLPTIGLGCYARGKGYSVFWAAMGVLPFLGPILAFVAIGIDDVLAKRAAPRLVRRVVKVGFALVVVTLLGVAIVLPSAPGLYDGSMVNDLIQKLETHKSKHGAYPATLEPLHVIRPFCNDGERTMTYRPSQERTQFTLTCFARGPAFFSKKWEVYRSKTQAWTVLED